MRAALLGLLMALLGGCHAHSPARSAPSVPLPVASAPAPSASVPSLVTGSHTVFGAVAARGQATPADLVRIYFTGLPGPWATLSQRVAGRDAVVSFKAAPQSVLSGEDDAALREWFAGAPRSATTWWSYDIEPENEIDRGEYTAQQFRDAFARVASLSREAHNPSLRATLVLFCYTSSDKSPHDPEDYYAGSAAVDVLAFDCFNFQYAGDGGFVSPAEMMDKIVRLAARWGEPWGLAELGSVVPRAGDEQARADWLTAIAAYAATSSAEFVSYFDTNTGPNKTDYRLLDAPARDAWSSVEAHGGR